MTPIWGTFSGGSARRFGRGISVVLGPSAAPSNLSATPAYAGSTTTAQMSLSWTNGDATSQTEVYNGASLVTTVNAGGTSYTVTNLNSNTSYSFTVKHIKSGNRSAASNTATNTTYYANGELVSQTTNYTDGINGTVYLSDYITLKYFAYGNGTSYSSRYFKDAASSWPGYAQSYGAGTFTYTVPSGVTTISIYGHGAGGGSTAYAGAGGAVKGWGISVSEGQQYSISVCAAGGGTDTTLSRSGTTYVRLQPGSSNGYSGGTVLRSGKTCSGTLNVYGYLDGVLYTQGSTTYAYPTSGTSDIGSGLGGCYQGYLYDGGLSPTNNTNRGGLQGGPGYSSADCDSTICNCGNYVPYCGDCCSGCPDRLGTNTGYLGFAGNGSGDGFIGILENPTYYLQNSSPNYFVDASAVSDNYGFWFTGYGDDKDRYFYADGSTVNLYFYRWTT